MEITLSFPQARLSRFQRSMVAALDGVNWEESVFIPQDGDRVLTCWRHPSGDWWIILIVRDNGKVTVVANGVVLMLDVAPQKRVAQLLAAKLEKIERVYAMLWEDLPLA